MNSRWGAGRSRDQEFGFGHDEVPNRLPSGSVERLSEYESEFWGKVQPREIYEFGRPREEDQTLSPNV